MFVFVRCDKDIVFYIYKMPYLFKMLIDVWTGRMICLRLALEYPGGKKLI